MLYVRYCIILHNAPIILHYVYVYIYIYTYIILSTTCVSGYTIISSPPATKVTMIIILIVIVVIVVIVSEID